VADINKITGYIRGGCSPIALKKPMRIVLDSSCINLDKMIVSAGKIGYQVCLSPIDLQKLLNADYSDISVGE
jgi:Cys-tRNA(Pro)/Cys-tRNA(Cys) deacylase